MRNHRLNYAVVGLFVITMLSAAVVTAVVLAGRTGARDSYHVVFDNVADIKFGTQVRFEGYALGQVEDIRPLREAEMTRFQLEISVGQGFPIPEDMFLAPRLTGVIGHLEIEPPPITQPPVVFITAIPTDGCGTGVCTQGAHEPEVLECRHLVRAIGILCASRFSHIRRIGVDEALHLFATLPNRPPTRFISHFQFSAVGHCPSQKRPRLIGRGLAGRKAFPAWRIEAAARESSLSPVGRGSG